MQQRVALLALVIFSSAYACGQSETALREYFEGKTVVAKRDLPANKPGVDVYPDAAPGRNDTEYEKQLKQSAVAIRRNESATLTKINVKEKSIDLQLRGSRLGLVNDTDAPSIYVAADKTQREKNLERDVERETDPELKKKMEDELDDLRERRGREDVRLAAALSQLATSRRQSNRERAADEGSRLSLMFPGGVPARALTPEYVMAALKPWIDFDVERASVTAEESGSATALRKGLSEVDLQRMFGDPVKREPGPTGDFRVEVLTFKQNGAMLEATMVEGVLVRFKQWSY